MEVAPDLAGGRGIRTRWLLLHMGQHYDARRSNACFQDLGLPEPDHHLGVGSGSHAQQTAGVTEAFEPVLLETRPDNVEAGLRSGDWRMPEEANRVLTDRLSDFLLTPSRDALLNLLARSVSASSKTR